MSSHKKELSDRNEVKKGSYSWYRLERPREKKIFDAKEKLVVPYRAEFNKFAYDNEQYFNDGGDIRAIVIKEEQQISIKYILGILNSTLMNWLYGFIGKPKGKMREYFNEPMAKFPIKKIDFNNKQDKENHDSLTALVDNIIQTQKDYNEKKDSTDDLNRRLFEQKINLLDNKINELVYRLYGLTEEEIKIIEGE